MANRGMLQLLGPTERAILQILWRDGPSTARHIQAQLQHGPKPLAYMTVISPLQSLRKKGFVTRMGQNADCRYHALEKEVLLFVACERMLGELDATPSERRRLAEMLYE